MHSLAIDLGGMTVSELAKRMGYAEFNDWMRYYSQQQSEPEPKTATPDDFIKAFNIDA